MTVNDKKKDIKQEIDNDAGLSSKRKLLTVTSLILLAIQFSGAQVKEANTFILKLSFEHQNGIGLLLALAIIFLLIRYYNYARPYHEKIFHQWSSRMLQEPLFIEHNFYENLYYGLIVDLVPKGLNIYELDQSEHFSWEYKYNCRFFLARDIEYSWSDQNDSYSSEISLFESVSKQQYLKIMGYELKYQIISIFTNRETLDIYTPYILGIFSISSYFFNEHFQLILKFFL